MRIPTLAKDIMTKDVITIDPDRTLVEAARLMAEKNIGSLVVVERGKTIGIITERDFLQVVSRTLNVEKVKVREIMSKPVVTCEPETRLVDLVSLMQKRRIRHVPIVKKGKLIGMVSSFDLACYGITVVLP